MQRSWTMNYFRSSIVCVSIMSCISLSSCSSLRLLSIVSPRSDLQPHNTSWINSFHLPSLVSDGNRSGHGNQDVFGWTPLTDSHVALQCTCVLWKVYSWTRSAVFSAQIVSSNKPRRKVGLVLTVCGLLRNNVCPSSGFSSGERCYSSLSKPFWINEHLLCICFERKISRGGKKRTIVLNATQRYTTLHNVINQATSLHAEKV